MPEAVLVSAVRTPVGRAPKGALSTTRPDDLAATALSGALDKVPGLDKAEIDDVILGCAQPEGEQGWNMARWAALRAGLPVEIPGVTVNRLCSSGLEAIAQADQRIRAGGSRVVVAGGAEIHEPASVWRPQAQPQSLDGRALSRLAADHGADRRAGGAPLQRLARRSGRLRAGQPPEGAGRAGRGTVCRGADSGDGDDSARPGRERPASRQSTRRVFAADEGPRADTSAEALAKLKPAFHAQGTVTAGQLVADLGRRGRGGADGCRRARRSWAFKPLARLVAYAVTGCLPEEMGMGPVTAIPKALKQAGLTLDDIGLIELNEAFAAQALAVIRALGIDPERVNVNGGAIALGPSAGLHRRQADRDAAAARCAAARCATAW